MRLLILAAVLLASGSTCYGADRLLCITEKSTGFKFNGKEWDIATFRVTDSKYILVREDSELEKQKGVKFEMRNFASGKLESLCRNEEHDTVECLFPTHFEINTKTLRFKWDYPFGYLDGKDSNDDTPAMGIGKCARIP